MRTPDTRGATVAADGSVPADSSAAVGSPAARISAPLDLRVRALGWLVRRGMPVPAMTSDDIRRAQQRRMSRNKVTDLLFGATPRGVAALDRTVPGPGGALALRVYRAGGAATSSAPLVINYHGGGWTFGTLDQSDWLCGNVAAAVGTVVVSVDYRLAPTHRFPAAVEDAYAGLLWAVEHADELGADPARVAVMGDSAGGNLAAVTCLVARERSGPHIAHQGLLYPATDLTTAERPSFLANADKPVLSRADVDAYRDNYLGDADGASRDPHASPLLADDLTGLPPALIQVAEHDPIRDDGVAYAAALRRAGVPVRLTEYVGMPHGYLSFPRICRAAPQALAELCAGQVAALAPAAGPRG